MPLFSTHLVLRVLDSILANELEFHELKQLICIRYAVEYTAQVL